MGTISNFLRRRNSGEYDPDFDDTPPSSPKLAGRHYATESRSFLPRVRRARNLLITIVVLFGLIYYFSHSHRPIFRPQHAPSITFKNVQWRHYSYVLYTIDQASLCNAVMVLEALDRLGSKADKVLMYPSEWDSVVTDRLDRDSQLLNMAHSFGAKLLAVRVPGVIRDGGDEQAVRGTETWDMSVTKFLAFNDTMLPYSRVILLESDITLFRNLDELFLLPPAVTAMSRAYWTLPAQKMLSPHLVVFEPSEVETGRLMEAASTFQAPDSENVDIGVMNKLYADSAMVLPHRRYGLVTSEYRTKNHTNYLGNDYEVWNPDKALREASLVHFSGDSPIPKPWIMWPQNMLHDMVPKCDYKPGTAEESGCRGREIWMELYNNFRKRRKDICRFLSMAAPNWQPPAPSPSSSV